MGTNTLERFIIVKLANIQTIELWAKHYTIRYKVINRVESTKIFQIFSIQ